MNWQIRRNDILAKIVIAFVLLAALAIRLGGANYGLPYSIGHVDEAPFMLNPVAFMALRTLQPVFFDYPTFYSYILVAVYGLLYFIGHTLGVFGSMTEMILDYSIHPGNYFLVARIITACFGVGTVWLTYAIGHKNFGRVIGLVAAVLLAFSFTHVSQSHWALPDVPMTFFVTAALYFICRLSGQGRLRDYAFAGILCGLAISTKYNAGLVLIPLFVAHILGRRAEGLGFFAILVDRRLIIAYVLVAYSFILSSPYWILDFRTYLAAFQLDVTHMSEGQLGNYDPRPWLWVLNDMIKEELLIGAASLFGVIYALLRPTRITWVLVSFVAITFLYIGSWSKPGLHYMLSIWAVLALLAARALYEVAQKLAGNVRSRRLLTAALLFIIVLPSIIQSAWIDYQMSNEDTRVTAKNWIEAHIPATTAIGLNWYDYNPPLLSYGTPYFPSDVMTWPDAEYQKALGEYLSRAHTYRLSEIGGQSFVQTIANENKVSSTRIELPAWKSLDQLKTEGVEYIILSSYVYERYTTSEPPPLSSPLRSRFDANKNYFAGLLHSPDLTLVMEFVPDATHLGPTLKVYQLKTP